MEQKMKKPVVIILLAFALLFVLAGIGATILFFFEGADIMSNRPLIYETAEESKTLSVKGPVTLNVHDDAGDVTVVSGRIEKEVTVRVIKTGAAFTQAGAEKDLGNIKYNIKQDGNTITLTYKVENLSINNSMDTVDFIVTVPAETSVDVDAEFGEINVTDTQGDLNIVNSFGDVIILNIEGGVTVETQSGKVDATALNAGDEPIKLSSGFGTVSLEGANGKDITLDSNSGVLEMSDVRAVGKVEMNTEFGDIRFTNGSANSLSVETNSGRLTLDRLTLRGAVTAKSEFGEISLEQVRADSYDLETNSGSVTADGVSGKVKAHSGFGSVTVRNADSVTLDLSTQSGTVDFAGSLGNGPHTVQTDFGEISLTIPADSALNVDLKTDFGSIRSDIPITVILSGDIEKSHQTGTMNEGGDQLTVETQSGSITIQASR